MLARSPRGRGRTLSVTCFMAAMTATLSAFSSPVLGAKPGADEAVALLKAGNQRFVNDESVHPNTDASRLAQAGSENQGDHAFATVITCSDSRVPVERLFDAGVMDVFVIRVAGNVCDTDEIGSIEYGLAHVNTPVLVVLGHKQCGAVTAVTAAVQGHGHQLERNIPPLVDNIAPAVQRAIASHPHAEGTELVEAGIEENVWQSIEDLFHESPATRELVKSGKTKVLGAIYDVGTGEVEWLAESKTKQILAQVEKDPTRAMNVYADGHDSAGHGDTAPTPTISAALSKAEREALLAKPVNPSKPTPDQAIAQLRAGNQRFVAGESNHPNTDAARLFQAGSENQGDHAFATVITCSDSRVPVERVFDAGVMDTFIIRVAGNVCDTDEIGSIEYGLAHVNTPVLVVLGHKQCGAVNAVTAAVQGHGHQLERNIPPLVDNIAPAVQRAIAANPHAEGSQLIEAGVEENVWQSIEDLFHNSPATRELVKAGRTKVVGAIYDVGTGEVEWLSEAKTGQLLAKVESDATRAMNVFADSGKDTGNHPQADAHGVSAGSHGAGHGAPADGHGNASAHGTAPAYKEVKGLSKAEWEVHLGSTGTFAAPVAATARHTSFGANTGHAKPHKTPEAKTLSTFSTQLFIGLTALSLIVTVLLSFYQSKVREADGSSHRGFTLGTKMTLAMGAMVTLTLAVGTLSMWSQDTITKDSHKYTELVSEVELIAEIEIDALKMQLGAQEFIIENHDESLAEYSEYIAEAVNKAKACEQMIKDPEHLELAKEVEAGIHEFEEVFSQTVGLIDETNGIVAGQLAPATARLTDLLHAVIEVAEHNNDTHLAVIAADALNRLTLGRVGIMQYLHTGDHADAQYAIEQIALGEHELAELITQAKDPLVKTWLSEVDQGYLFYTERVQKLVNLLEHRHELVEKELNPTGEHVLKTAGQLVQALNQEADHLQEEIDTVTATARMEAIAIISLAMVLAVSITVVLVRSITSSVRRVLTVLQAVAAGDLTQEPLNDKRKDEMGELARATDRMGGSLTKLIGELAAASNDVASAATEIAASSEEMAQGMGEQNGEMMRISSAIEEMSSSVIEVARKSADAASMAAQAGQSAEQGGEVVRQTIDGMNEISTAVSSSAASVSELGKRGEQIGQIIEVINDIADQTNLLALNAAIEAARAGEHGRGFAVVADEVRKLADRTTGATDEIGESIKAIQTETEQAVQRMESGTQSVTQGVERATKAGESLSQIVSAAQEVATMIQSIAAAAEEQSAASEEVSRSVESVSAVSRQTSESTSQSATAANQLSSKAEELLAMVGRFKVRH